jgi:glycine cleavage system regulatory protein
MADQMMQPIVRITVRSYFTCDEGDVAADKSIMLRLDGTEKPDIAGRVALLIANQAVSLEDFPGTNVRFMTAAEAEAWESENAES